VCTGPSLLQVPLLPGIPTPPMRHLASSLLSSALPRIQSSTKPPPAIPWLRGQMSDIWDGVRTIAEAVGRQERGQRIVEGAQAAVGSGPPDGAAPAPRPEGARGVPGGAAAPRRGSGSLDPEVVACAGGIHIAGKVRGTSLRGPYALQGGEVTEFLSMCFSTHSNGKTIRREDALSTRVVKLPLLGPCACAGGGGDGGPEHGAPDPEGPPTSL